MKIVNYLKRIQVFAVTIFLSMQTFASDFYCDGIYYNILSKEDMTCEVTSTDSYDGKNYYSGDIVIPERIVFNNQTYTVTQIGVRAFANCKINSVKMSNTIQNLKEQSFSGSISLKKIDLSQNLTSIQDEAFFGCFELMELVVPESVIYIGEGAFGSCLKLSRINWPKRTLKILPRTFEDCVALQSALIPEETEEIGESTFRNCKSIESIRIPSKVVSIGKEAFRGCASVLEVQIPGTVKAVGEYAFADCENLSKVVLEEGVTEIGSYAFRGDYHIQEFFFPNSVTNIGTGTLALGTAVQPKEICLKKVIVGNNLKEFGPEITSAINAGWSFPEDVIFGEKITTVSDSRLFHRGPGYGLMPGANQYLLTNNIVSFSGCPSGRTPDCTIYVADSTKYDANTINKYNIKNLIHSKKTVMEYSGSSPNIQISCALKGFNIQVDPICYNVGNYESVKLIIKDEHLSSRIAVPCSYVIDKAPLSIIANDYSICYGDEIPIFDCTYIGLKNGEKSNDALSIQPTLNCGAGTDSNAGTYTINIGGAEAQNYLLSYKSGTLTINKAPQTISWNQIFTNTYIGDKIELEATSSKGLPVTYKSSDPTIAFVADEMGKQYLYLIKDGTVSITAMQSGTHNYEAAQDISKVVTVKAKMATGLSLNPSLADIHVGESITLTAKISPESVIEKGVNWSSSNSNVATVKDGVVVGISIGTAIITAKTTDGSNLSTTCTITVSPILASSISLDKTSVSIKLDEEIMLTALVLPEATTNKDITWVSSDSKIVQVHDGVITPVSQGFATITAKTTDGSDLSATCKVTVNGIMAQSLSLDKTSVELNVGESEKLLATIIPTNATNTNLEWITSNISVATIEDGLIRALSPGSATITAKTTDESKLTATCKVTVLDVPVTSLSLSEESVELLVEGETTLTAIVYPENASNKELSWSTSDVSVVTVDNGELKAIGSGQATIIVSTTDGTNISRICTVTVNKHPQTITWDQDLSSIAFGGELITLQATASSGLPVTFKSSNDNVANIFDMGDVIYLNAIGSGQTTVIATQLGNNYYAPVEMTKNVNVIDPSDVIDVEAKRQYVICTVSGILVGKYTDQEYKQLMINHRLPSGLYLVNGNKIIVK